MSFPMFNPRGPYLAPPRQRLFGVYPALVTDLRDEDRQGRVEVMLPWIDEASGQKARCWARLATLMAGKDRGTWFIPEKDDEVLVSFMAGDPRWPVVIGALWNGVDTPPETMDGAGENHIRSITSESGHKLTFDDTPGEEKVEVLTQGQHLLRLDDKAGDETITVRHKNGAEVVIDKEGTIKVTALKEVLIEAPEKLVITSAQVEVNAPLSTFSGIVDVKQEVKTASVNSQAYNHARGNRQ